MNPLAATRTVAMTWGSIAPERELEFPCDRYVTNPSSVLYRAITVNARPPVLFQWLCQLRAAPYSYDGLDNLGRRSPRRLTPGLGDLQIGQQIVSVFRLAAFEHDRHITAVLPGTSALFDELAMTYLILPAAEQRSRLVVKIAIRYPRNPIGLVTRALLPAGDLVMMRKQLLTLRALAQRDQRSRERSSA
jgi:hypothetical protein